MFFNFVHFFSSTFWSKCLENASSFCLAFLDHLLLSNWIGGLYCYLFSFLGFVEAFLSLWTSLLPQFSFFSKFFAWPRKAIFPFLGNHIAFCIFLASSISSASILETWFHLVFSWIDRRQSILMLYKKGSLSLFRNRKWIVIITKQDSALHLFCDFVLVSKCAQFWSLYWMLEFFCYCLGVK